MADDSGEDKSEAPTEKRRSEARNKGNVPKSTEVNSVLVLLSGLMLLKFFGPWMMRNIARYTSDTLMMMGHPKADLGFAAGIVIKALMAICYICWPVCLGILVIGVIANLIQVGFLFTFEPLIPKLEKINPIAGFGRLFALRSFVEMIKNILKLLIIGFVAYTTVAGDFHKIIGLADTSVSAIFMFMVAVSFKVILRVALVLLVLAILDYVYQRFEHEKGLKMSKQEIKEEHKQSEGDPQIKSRIKSLQREMARRRMIQEVPKATVVITNPTHIAIALQYDPSMESPKVLAKGKRLIAEQIKRIALDNGIPIVEDKPLARSMYDRIFVGESIPMEFFSAVAEILAYVYRLKKREAA